MTARSTSKPKLTAGERVADEINKKLAPLSPHEQEICCLRLGEFLFRLTGGVYTVMNTQAAAPQIQRLVSGWAKNKRGRPEDDPVRSAGIIADYRAKKISKAKMAIKYHTTVPAINGVIRRWKEKQRPT